MKYVVDPDVLDATIDIGIHINAIKDIANRISDPAETYALRMMAAHQLLELPADDPVAYQALEKVYLHFHHMEGKDNGTN